MSDLFSIYKKLRRSQILIRAARIGVLNYRRDRDIKRILRTTKAPAPKTGMVRLLTIERDLETDRRAGNTTYSITRHVEILAALIAEAQLLKALAS